MMIKRPLILISICITPLSLLLILQTCIPAWSNLLGIGGTILLALTTAHHMYRQIRGRELDRLNILHELRTSLTSITGYINMVLDGMDGEINEEQRKDLEIAYQSSLHLINLINDLSRDPGQRGRR